MGEIPSCTPCSLTWTMRSTPSRFASRSRKSIISRNFQVVSTCSRGNGGFAGMKSLHRQMQQHRGVLADRIEHHRLAELGRHLAHDINAFGLETLQVARG